MKTEVKKEVRIHLTNIAGLGAIQLIESLLPSLLKLSNYQIGEIYLPSHSKFTQLLASHPKHKQIPYKRYLPNSLSRILECTIFGSKFDGATPLLVLGDIPIRCHCRQVVFVQSSLLTQNARTGRSIGAIKYWAARTLFKFNSKFASAFIVQTEAMKEALVLTYPQIKDRLFVLAQPVTNWLVNSQMKRNGPHTKINSGLNLFYPAASYPHKNHRLLSKIQKASSQSWPIAKLILTVPESLNPNSEISWIQCVDRLESSEVVQAYNNSDALLFLSLSESFGFPLIEAMWIGLPIICPDLPYARILCGDQAIYFNPDQIDSFHEAVVELENKMKSGWWPDWKKNLEKIPKDWKEVAEEMLRITT